MAVGVAITRHDADADALRRRARLCRNVARARRLSAIALVMEAHRHAHHIHVGDVSHGIIRGMERAIAGSGALGSVPTFNLSEDEFSEPTHAEFTRKASEIGGDRRFRVFRTPWFADWMRDFPRFGTLPLRNPGRRMRFPNDRSHAAGFRLRFGMAQAHAPALERIQSEKEHAFARRSVADRHDRGVWTGPGRPRGRIREGLLAHASVGHRRLGHR